MGFPALTELGEVEESERSRPTRDAQRGRDEVRKYSKKASSDVRVAYGVELIAGLETFDSSRELAKSLLPINDELKKLRDDRAKKEHERAVQRARLRSSEYKLDQAVRSFARAVEIADGGRKGSTYAAVFPDGVTPLIAPQGRGQVAPAEKFLERVRTLKNATLESVRAEWLPKIESAATEFNAAIGAYDAAARELSQIFARELVVRDEHELSVERIMGHVKALFPRDPGLRDVIFPFIGSRRSGDAEDDDVTELEAAVTSAAE